MSGDPGAAYFRYWGKALSSGTGATPYHLLVFHSLDVAACGLRLMRLPQFSLAPLARELDWSLPTVEALALYFLILHDVGKFARGFQGLAPNLSPLLVQNDKGKPYRYRHDTLGWLLWADVLSVQALVERLPESDHEFWAVWARTACGHHGKPPMEVGGGGLIPLEARQEFLREDIRAATQFAREAADIWLPADLPAPSTEQLATLRRHAWWLAGFAVLADWLGSNQEVFTYCAQPMPMDDYWRRYALPRSEEAVSLAGLEASPVRVWSDPTELFEYLREPTPLQRYAASVQLQDGPQLFLLEDVTGAGKTEAALILVQRLMQNGLARGLYFALPSMATANQMYQRVGVFYRRLYAPDARPSLVLSHGARQLMDAFRESIVLPGEQPSDRRYDSHDATASAECNAWLADSRKKALLADVGVGTLDQALLGVLPVRHQSLRLLGLAGKVLVVDEVHSYDPYMRTLLKRLLQAHARQGGSVILLSATLPAFHREELILGYRAGLGLASCEIPPDERYPLSTQVGEHIVAHACDTRPQLVRRVAVAPLHDETQVLELVTREAGAGRCVCWIRNTVDDACRAYDALASVIDAERLDLFHGRFAMGDRLDIEERVLRNLGKFSGPQVRRGRVLIGTQVLEQSLDYCVDVMVTDLAPIDLMIQRAGRLQRHARLADGTPAPDGIERRPLPILYVLMPPFDDEPGSDWYAALFPKASFVYPNVGELWLGARALVRAGCIVSPGSPDEPGAVRNLVESVYGAGAELIPSSLQRATQEQIGKDLAAQSQGGFNVLDLRKGYCWDGSALWDGEAELPTRLGDDTVTVYLAIERDGGLLPWRHDLARHAWEQSAVRVNARRIAGLAPECEERFAIELQKLRAQHRLLEPPSVVLPLVSGPQGWTGLARNAAGQAVELRYDTLKGLLW